MLEEKVQVYEQLFHRINVAMLTGNTEHIKEILTIIFEWSYAHRSGNGELTEEEQQEQINYHFEKMKNLEL